LPEDERDLIPASTPGETALDVAAFVGSAVPWIGGPVSNVLGGISMGRKLARVREVLEGLVTDLAEFKSEVAEEYVKTEEFEELLEQTLKRAADERNEEKRRIYRAFLTDAIESPGKPYDEQIRFLRTLEELQPDHLKVLRALSQTPEPNPGITPNQTLRRRLPELEEARIEDLVTQLNDLRVTNLTNLKVMMTGHGAENLQHAITQYGNRFLQYLIEAQQDAAGRRSLR
jgi:hypothetical protein